VIDIATNNVVATMFLGENQNPFEVAITPDGSRAYVTINALNLVSVIDTTINTVIATIPVGLGPIGVATTPDGTRAYVADNDANTISVIDIANNTVTATLGVGVSPNSIAISPGIGPPINKDQCKDGGWRNFTVPRAFKNQGNCIRFVNTGK
jgi:YVTN family beta-propeller protein